MNTYVKYGLMVVGALLVYQYSRKVYVLSAETASSDGRMKTQFVSSKEIYSISFYPYKHFSQIAHYARKAGKELEYPLSYLMAGEAFKIEDLTKKDIDG